MGSTNVGSDCLAKWVVLLVPEEVNALRDDRDLVAYAFGQYILPEHFSAFQRPRIGRDL